MSKRTGQEGCISESGAGILRAVGCYQAEIKERKKMEVWAALKASPIFSAKYVRPGYCIAITDAGLSLLILTLDEHRQLVTWFRAAMSGDLDIINLFAQSHYPDFDLLGWQPMQSMQEIEQYPNWPRISAPSPHCLAKSRPVFQHRRAIRRRCRT